MILTHMFYLSSSKISSIIKILNHRTQTVMKKILNMQNSVI